MAKLWNFVQFQLGWFALVLGSAWGEPAVGMAVAAILVLLHLGWFAPDEWLLFAVIGAFGWIWETVLYHSGLLVYSSYPEGMFLAPPWMALLWLNFATSLNHSLGWLKGEWSWAVVFGASGGPLAFWGGAKLGAITFVDELQALVVLAVAWALLMPAAMWLAGRLTRDRVAQDGVGQDKVGQPVLRGGAHGRRC